jgi:hypothetical protein
MARMAGLYMKSLDRCPDDNGAALKRLFYM